MGKQTEVAVRDLKTESFERRKAAGEIQTDVKIIRPSELAESNFTGLVVTGVLEKTAPNKFDKTKKDFFVKDAAGVTYIINECKALKEQIGQDGIVGMRVTINYYGKLPTPNGKGFHDFECFAEAVK